jgi:transcriptional regulator with XRE-family HTH domain
MNVKTFVEEVASTEEGKRAFNQECAILELTELICRIMEQTDVSRAELARRLGKTKGYVTQLLDGRANMTLRTIADVFTALGRTIHFHDGSHGGQRARLDSKRTSGNSRRRPRPAAVTRP